MTTPRSISTTLNGLASKCQGKPFDEFPVDLTPAYLENEITTGIPKGGSILSPKSRLLALTPSQQRLVRAVRKLPGSDSVTIGNAVYLTRYAALSQMNNLADVKRVLKSDKYDEARGGARKSLHFWLADDISAELVDAVLGDSDADAEAALSIHQQQLQAEPVVEPRKKPDLNPMAVFAALPQPVQQIAIAIAQAEDEDISAIELSRTTGQPIKRIYDRLPMIVDPGLAVKQLIPGFKNKYVYKASPALFEIVGQLSPDYAEDAQEIFAPVHDVGTSQEAFSSIMKNSSTQPTSQQLTEDTIANLSQDNQEIWLILSEMAEEISQLKQQFKQIELSIRGKRIVKADDIRAILHKADK